MERKYFNAALKLSAFFLPFYFIFYPHLNDNSGNPLIKSLWKLTFAGFCFYGVLAAAVFVIS